MPDESLPDKYEWFEDQIAGHHPSVIKNGKREIGILKKPGSTKILKPFQDEKRGECEASVYRLMHCIGQQNNSDERPVIWKDALHEDIIGLSRVTPGFYGIKPLVVDGDDHKFLVLDDVSASYKRPAILDVKMGRVTFDPFADESKRKKESEKYPPQYVMGFRLLGYKMHHTGGEAIFKDKDWGKSYDESDVHKGLLEYLSGRGSDSSVTQGVLDALEPIRRWFSRQNSFHFYASSLLFLYETDPSLSPNVNVYMIDFSHVFAGEGKRDENYIYGLNNLLNRIESIHSSFKE